MSIINRITAAYRNYQMQREFRKVAGRVKLVTYIGSGGAPVIHIDTPDIQVDRFGPVCRIYLNDGEIYENPPYGQ